MPIFEDVMLWSYVLDNPYYDGLAEYVKAGLDWRTVPFANWWMSRRYEKMHPYWRELKEYVETELNEEFRTDWMGGWDSLVDDDVARFDDPVDFYKRTKVYLYHLTAFSLDVWKTPYFVMLIEALLPHERGGTVLDYGCGIGADGLLLWEKWGFQPSFADFQSECTRYLAWRLARRGMEAEIYDIEGAEEIPRHDLVVSFDVVEHVPPEDQGGFVVRLAELGRTVALNMPDGRARSKAHYEVDVAALLGVIYEVGTFRRHDTVNEFQHFVVFDTPDPPKREEPARPREAPPPEADFSEVEDERS